MRQLPRDARTTGAAIGVWPFFSPASVTPSATRTPRMPPPPRMERMIFSLAASGNMTEAVRMIDNIRRTAITPPVNRLSQRVLTHGPSTALSLHSSSRNTVALGKSTPASVCTALVKSPSGALGVDETGGDHNQAVIDSIKT